MEEPMVILMLIDLMLCHCFFMREARKLSDITMLALNCSSVISSCPMAVFKLVTFLSCHLTELLTSSIFLEIGSFLVTGAGNIPILLRTGPRTAGIFLTRASVAKRTAYFLAQALMSFLSLLNFLRNSILTTSTASRPAALASSLCFSSAMKQIFILGLGMFGRVMVPANLLSFCGS